jgi:hypothetical protein
MQKTFGFVGRAVEAFFTAPVADNVVVVREPRANLSRTDVVVVLPNHVIRARGEKLEMVAEKNARYK